MAHGNPKQLAPPPRLGARSSAPACGQPRDVRQTSAAMEVSMGKSSENHRKYICRLASIYLSIDKEGNFQQTMFDCGSRCGHFNSPSPAWIGVPHRGRSNDWWCLTESNHGDPQSIETTGISWVPGKISHSPEDFSTPSYMSWAFTQIVSRYHHANKFNRRYPIRWSVLVEHQIPAGYD